MPGHKGMTVHQHIHFRPIRKRRDVERATLLLLQLAQDDARDVGRVRPIGAGGGLRGVAHMVELAARSPSTWLRP